LILFLQTALLVAAAGAAVPSPMAPSPFHVNGRKLAQVYVDAGRKQGVGNGDHLKVVAGDTVVAELEVIGVAEEAAVCRVLSVTRPIRNGDAVTPVKPPARLPTGFASLAPKETPAPAPTPTPSATKPTPAPTPAAKPLAVAAATTPTPVPTPTPTPIPAQTATKPAPVAKASATPAPPPTAVATAVAVTGGDDHPFSVRYRSAGNVYLDGGSADGLSIGDRLRLAGGQGGIAELEVVYAAEQSASCRVLSETRPVKAGDRVVVSARVVPIVARADVATGTPAAAAAPEAAATPAPSLLARTPAAPWGRLRGSVSASFYKTQDNTASGLDFEQRSARADLTATDIGGQPLSFTLRTRTRQDIRARALSDRTPQSERNDLLYEAALRYEPPSDAFGLEVGRIGLYRFVGIGYLDGALARFKPMAGLNVGAFGGRAVELDGLGFNGTGAKYGAFVQLAPGGRYSTKGYDALLAVVREQANGDVSREYLSLESRFSGGRRWTIFERAELDLNRGWRQDLSGKTFQLSNVSLSGNLLLLPSTWAFLSYDGRRNYRYYLNRTVPEEVFDDLLHQGLRGGLNLSRPSGFGATAGFGMSLKEPDPRNPELNIANAYSFNGGVRHTNLFGLSVGLDASGFSNGYADGGLVTARVGRRFRAGHMLDLSYGRSLYRVKPSAQSTTTTDRNTQWLRLTGRFELNRHAFVTGDFEYDKGDDLEGPRGYFEAGWIF
jgi:hypothetical protein